MVSFDGLHQARGFRRLEVQPLTLRHGNRSRVRAADHDDRNAYSVEASYIGDTGDAEVRHERTRALQRVGGRNRAVSALAVRLVRATVAINLRAMLGLFSRHVVYPTTTFRSDNGGLDVPRW